MTPVRLRGDGSTAEPREGEDGAKRTVAEQLGETLVELLATVAIMSIAFVSIIGAIYTAVTQTRIHHDQTDVLAALTTAAEVVKDATFTACVGSAPGSEDPAGQGPASSSYSTAISNYFADFPLAQGDVGVPTIISVVGDTGGASACPANLGDIQLITLTDSSNDGQITYSLQVVKGSR